MKPLNVQAVLTLLVRYVLLVAGRAVRPLASFPGNVHSRFTTGNHAGPVRLHQDILEV